MAAYAIQFRRGTTTQHNSFTGLLGEVTVDTDKKTLVVHDGSTTGGFPLAREGANLSSAEGSFTSNVSVGGTFSVTSTASFSDDVTITGDLGMTGHIIPSANITYDLGSSTMMWRDIYVGPGSLYVNGKKVIEDNAGTINITTDANQNLKVETTGTGSLQLSSAAGITVNGEVNALTGDIQFGDHLDMNSNRIKEVSAPVDSTDAANKSYVDSTISTKLGDGTLSFDGVDGDFSGNVAIAGNLTITGTTTTVNAETINLADNILLLNSNATGTASQNGGIEIERGDDLNVQFLWDETNDRWSIASEDLYTGGSFIGDLTGDVTGTVSSLSNHDTGDLTEGTNLYWTTARGDANFATNLASSDTDDLSEGTANLYYTTARVNTAFDTRLATKSTTDLSEGANLYWTSARGDANFATNLAASDTGDLTEGTNLYWTSARGDANFATNLAASDTGDLTEGTNLYWTTARGEAMFDTKLAAADTDDLSEGTGNLYFTDARARSALSVTGDLTYNTSTGEFSFTERTDAEVRGLVSVTDAGGDGSLSYNASTGVITYTGPSATEVRAHFSAGTGISITNGVIANTQSEDYVSSATFNASTGVLSLGRVQGGTVTVDLDGRYMNADSGFTYAHSSAQTVNATVATNNGSGAVTFDFNELEGAMHYTVYLNRQLLRPGEFSVNTASTTANLTISTGVLAEDDELEVVTLKAANQS